jgi:glycerophosphoryl diester phosphodiesterase
MTDGPLVFGHRGAPRRARENTLAAFAQARELGADGVELDVRLTSDGVAVVNHDPHVEGYGLVRARPFVELRAAQPEVPTLAEALDALAGLIVNVEIKCLPWDPDPDPDGLAPRLVAQAVADRDCYDRVVVSSFDLAVLGPLRDRDARLTTGWLTHGQAVESTAPLAAERGAQWLHPDRAAVIADPRRACEDAHARGLQVNVWTVNEPDEMRALVAAKVDGIITDVPDVARSVVDT